MPELPEVETTRRGLAPHLTGRRIAGFAVHDRRLRWPIARALPGQLAGQRINAVERRAKYLLLRLDHGTLILHLGMSGSLRVLDAGTPRLKHDHYDLVLEGKRTLRFNDPRRFGCCLYTTAPPERHRLLRRLAPEPFDPAFGGAYLQRIARRRKVAIKLLIMNGQLVTGVGNIYASEALFHAQVRPRRAARSLSGAECAALARAIRKVLRASIRSGGTTLRDYTNAEGSPGYFRQRLYVYERAGQPCRRCHTPIRQFTQGQRSTYWCPTCQH